MGGDKQLAAARAEAEAAQAGFVEAVGDLGRSASTAQADATARAKRIAPIALAATGALMAVGLLRKLR